MAILNPRRKRKGISPRPSWAAQRPPPSHVSHHRTGLRRSCGEGQARGGSGNFLVPVFIGEHPLTVFALIDLSISKTFLLDLVVEGLVQGADSVAGVLLVSPQVELWLKKFITVLAAKRVLFYNRHRRWFWLVDQEVQASLIILPNTGLVKKT